METLLETIRVYAVFLICIFALLFYIIARYFIKKNNKKQSRWADMVNKLNDVDHQIDQQLIKIQLIEKLLSNKHK